MTLRSAAQQGFTLVEMLAVLAIVAVIAGTATLAVGRGGQEAETEARRLSGQLSLAADEALVTQRTLTLDWDERGYRVLVQDDGGEWAPYPIETLGERHDLPRGVRLVSDAARPAPLGLDGAGPGFRMSLSGGGETWGVSFDGLDATASADSGA